MSQHRVGVFPEGCIPSLRPPDQSLITLFPNVMDCSTKLFCLFLGVLCGHHYDWWGLWLPYKAPCPGGLRCWEDHLSLPLHGQQVQPEVYHHSRHRLPGKASGEFCLLPLFSPLLLSNFKIAAFIFNHSAIIGYVRSGVSFCDSIKRNNYTEANCPDFIRSLWKHKTLWLM